MCNALAIVMSRAAGTQQPAVERAGTKRVQSAFAAQAGLEAALLAAHGLDGPTGAIDGKHGLFAKYEGGDRAVVLDRLGRTYLTERLSYKKFPCCACSHAAMEAALHLRRDHELTASDISGIEVTITPYMSKLVGAPFDPAGNPTVTAQFSIRYGVAATLLRGGFGVADILPQNVLATDVTELANRVVVTEFEGHEGRLAPATLTLTLADGQTVSKHVDTIPGSPDTPLSPQDFTAKITDCVTQGDHALSQAQCERLFGAVERLEAFDDISVLFPWIFEGETGHETTRAGA